MQVRIVDANSIRGSIGAGNIAGTDCNLCFRETPGCHHSTIVTVGRYQGDLGSASHCTVGFKTEWVDVKGEKENEAARYLTNMARKKDPRKFNIAAEVDITGEICLFSRVVDKFKILMFRYINKDQIIDSKDGDGETIINRPNVKAMGLSTNSFHVYDPVLSYAIITKEV